MLFYAYFPIFVRWRKHIYLNSGEPVVGPFRGLTTGCLRVALPPNSAVLNSSWAEQVEIGHRTISAQRRLGLVRPAASPLITLSGKSKVSAEKDFHQTNSNIKSGN